MEYIPPSVRHKAKRILLLLKQNSEVDWNDKGELIYRQSTIFNSHMADLLANVLKTKTVRDPPIGWLEFAVALASSKVPKELITNYSVWKIIKAINQVDHRIVQSSRTLSANKVTTRRSDQKARVEDIKEEDEEQIRSNASDNSWAESTPAAATVSSKIFKTPHSTSSSRRRNRRKRKQEHQRSNNAKKQLKDFDSWDEFYY